MEEKKKLELKLIANEARGLILDMVYKAKSGHPGGSLSACDYMTYLYFNQMRIDPKNPKWENRDRLVLSKGHVTPILYSCLALRGYFDKSLLAGFRQLGSILQGHPDMKNTPGVDMSTGSLGQGLSCACGMAFEGKNGEHKFNVYAIVGDGELQEGQIWEACMFAGNKHLNNLCVVVDYNHIQICGFVEEINNPAPIDAKLASFGFDTITVNGHDFDELEKAFNLVGKSDKPLAVICQTVKGKGVSFMENQAKWHGKAPGEEDYLKAKEEINKERELLLKQKENA